MKMAPRFLWGGDVVAEACLLSAQLFELLPERNPVDVAAADHFVVQQVKERLVDYLPAGLLGCDDVCV